MRSGSIVNLGWVMNSLSWVAMHGTRENQQRTRREAVDGVLALSTRTLKDSMLVFRPFNDQAMCLTAVLVKASCPQLGVFGSMAAGQQPKDIPRGSR